MEFYLGLLSPLAPHFKEYMILYLLGVPIMIVIIALTRRYSIPLIIFLLELTIYSSIMHTIFHVIVRVFTWFKNSSSMKMIRDPDDMVEWTTPLFSFWQIEQYDPNWLIYVEIVLFTIVLLLTIYIRPLKPQYKHKSRFNKPGTPVSKSKSKIEDDKWGVPKQYGVSMITKSDSKRK